MYKHGAILCVSHIHICHVSDTVMDAEGFSSHICLTYPQPSSCHNVLRWVLSFHVRIMLFHLLCLITWHTIRPSDPSFHHPAIWDKVLPKYSSSLKYPFLNPYSSPVPRGFLSQYPEPLSHGATMSMSVSAISVS